MNSNDFTFRDFLCTIATMAAAYGLIYFLFSLDI